MSDYRVVVIGAGVSGLCAGVRLKQAGIHDFAIFEKADSVGGAWRDNTYPGVACDVPSHLYSFSFALNPDWSRTYAPGGEIWNYLKSCSERYQLEKHLQYNKAARQLKFKDNHWLIKTEDGRQCTADAVILATGGLHTPNMPAFPGMTAFKGKIFHTARWDHRHDLTGMRVAMIGTGASGVQVAPEIAKIVAHLSVFQRSPVWVMPKIDPVFGDEQKSAFRRSLLRTRLHRHSIWRGWERFSFDTAHDTPVNRQLRNDGIAFIRSQVPDQATADRLIPSYPYGCKRPTMSNGYFAAFARPNVSLVTAHIRAIEEGGIRTDDDVLHAVDTIILATGFQAYDVTSEMSIAGLHGQDLRKTWDAEGIHAYRSVMIPQFPNLFLTMGPNSAALTSAFEVLEAQVGFAVKFIKEMSDRKLKGAHPKAAPTADWQKLVQAGIAETIIAQGCRTWWTDQTGYNYVNWPYSSVQFRRALKTPRFEEFVVF